MKYSQYLGMAAAVILVAACFLPWTWYPDIQKSFNGFFSEQNVYGKPGRVLIFFAAIAVFFYIVPRVWAKRANLLICSITLAYAIKSFILFSGCYRGVCPERQAGIWILLISAALMMLAAVVPDTSLRKKMPGPNQSIN